MAKADYQTQIKYEHNGSNYMVQMSAHSDPLPVSTLIAMDWSNRSVFERLKDHPALNGLTGEELVKKILLVSSKANLGNIYMVERFKEGVPNNGPNGEPAVMEFTKKGLIIKLYNDGKLQDGPNGEMAVQVLAYGKDGFVPTDECRSYTDGVENATPAERKLSVRTTTPAVNKPNAPKMGM